MICMSMMQVYANEGNALVEHLSSLDDITASYSEVPSLAEPMEALPSRPKPVAAAAAASPAVPLPAGLEEDLEDMDQSDRNIAGGSQQDACMGSPVWRLQAFVHA